MDYCILIYRSKAAESFSAFQRQSCFLHLYVILDDNGKCETIDHEHHRDISQ